MNKRNTIIVVFRVVAIFLLFSSLANAPEVISRLSYTPEIVPVFRGFTIIMSIIVIALPITFSFLLWNKSDWIADKILKPFGMDELWDDEVVETTDENISSTEVAPIEEYTFTHLSRVEVESLAFSIIGVWVLSTAIPESIARIIYILDYPSYSSFSLSQLVALVYPLAKTIIGIFLVIRSNNLIAWLGKWRKLRMEA